MTRKSTNHTTLSLMSHTFIQRFLPVKVCKWHLFPPSRAVFITRCLIIYVQFLKMSPRALKMHVAKSKLEE